jgi:hypothetical protein
MFRQAFSVAVITFAVSGFAQEFRASISGQVRDSTGSNVPGATVTVTSIERNTSSQTVTNSAGHYLVQFLLPGHYTVSAEKEGFKKVVRTGISLEAADHVALDFALDVGALTQSVTVTGEAPLLENRDRIARGHG